MSRVFGTIGLLLVAGGGICLAQTEAPSLGDLARQQKHDKKAVIVLTDEDSTVVPASALSSGPAVPGTGPAPGNSSAGTGNTTDKTTGSDSLPTSNRSSAVSELKSKLDYLKGEQDSWKRSVKHYEELLANESSDFRRQMYQDALDNDRQNVALYGRKIDEAQAELAKAQQASSAADKSSNQNSPPNGTKEP